MLVEGLIVAVGFLRYGGLGSVMRFESVSMGHFNGLLRSGLEGLESSLG